MAIDSPSDDPEGPGFPIRKSTDQRLLAAPRSLSQRATSFVASWHQGIHQMPLRRLLEHPVTRSAKNHRARQRIQMRSCLNLPRPKAPRPKPERPMTAAAVSVQSSFTMSISTRDKCPETRLAIGSQKPGIRGQGSETRHPPIPRCPIPRSPSSGAGRWWSRPGSNRRPPACKAGALPAELRPRSRRPEVRDQRSGIRGQSRSAAPPAARFRRLNGGPGKT